MKSVITACIVFILIAGLALCGYYMSTNFAQDMLSGLKYIKDQISAGNWGAAGEKTLECIKRIEDDKVWLAAIANHEELNSMKTGLLRLEQYISYAEPSEAMAQSGELIGLLDHFYQSELVTIENVF